MISTRTLRGRLTIALVVVALVSVSLIGLLNVVAALALLDSGAQDRLTSIGQARARSIEAGAERLQARVSLAAADPAVAIALEELVAGQANATDALDADERTELETWYRSQVVDPIEAAGLDPVTVADVLPASAVGRSLQYHYTVGPRSAGIDPRELTDAGDGSPYSAAHADHHPYLLAVADGLGFGDLLLVSTAGVVVYSTDKRIDFGTDLESGPHRDTRLATALRDQLGRAATGGAVVADLELYLPARGAPTLFVAAPIRRGTAVIGSLAVEIPAASLSAITTAGGNWSAVGLPEGESYVVGADLILRSESRHWIEDPAGYLARVDDERLSELITVFDSPVGLQPVDTESVTTALATGGFEGQATNYLGESTFSSVVPIDVEGVDWLVVVDTPLGDARSGLYRYGIRLGIALLLLVSLAGLLGFLLADRLTRPIPPIVRAAREVAEGVRRPDLGDLGGDELGDLGRHLLLTANELGREEEQLAGEFERKRRLLLSVLPPRLVSEQGDVSDGAIEAIETTTAIAIGVTVGGDGVERDTVTELLAAVADLADTAATERGIERIRSAADRHLFLAGVGVPHHGADDALAFAAELVAGADRLVEGEPVEVDLHVGLSTGPIATGVLDGGSLTFGAWGEPVRRALAVAALSGADEILVDRSTVDAVERSEIDLVAASDIISLDGEPMGLLAVRVPPQRTTPAGSSPG